MNGGVTRPNFRRRRVGDRALMRQDVVQAALARVILTNGVRADEPSARARD